MSRDALVLEDHKVLIFWSRKAGNTSLCEWLAPLVDAEGFAASGREPRIFLRERGCNRTFDEIQEYLDRGFDTFVLARNPYSRFVSGFIDKYIFNAGRPMHSFDDLVRNARKTYLEAMTELGRSNDPDVYATDYPGISFHDLLVFVHHQLHHSLRRKRKEPKLNNHFNTQVPYAFEDFPYRNIMRLENIAADIVPLAERLSYDVPFPHARPMVPGITRVHGEGLSRTPSIEFVKAGTVPHAQSLLDDVTRPLLQEAFAIDFRKLGYPL